MASTRFKRAIYRLLQGGVDKRRDEYRVVQQYLRECNSVLDAGCGTGTFVATDPARIKGIDLNPENVEYCRERGCDVRVGNVLDIPFKDDAFDGVLCSHVMQVFAPDQAAQMMRELIRVTKQGGVVVIVTLNIFPRFFRHPENARPYPPDAIARYFHDRGGSTSPMYLGMGALEQEAIWTRKVPLFELHAATNPRWSMRLNALNNLQYRVGAVKFWTFDAYAIKLRVTAK